MILVGVIIAAIALCQAGINAYLITNDITIRAQAQLDIAARTTLSKFDAALQQSTEDLKVLLAHKALEDYFTAIALDDIDEMTNSVAVFENFLKKLHEAKPRYNKMQLTAANENPILQIDQGKRVESFTPFAELAGTVTWQKLLKPVAPAAAGVVVIHTGFFDEQAGWVVLSATPIRYRGITEGVLWLYQPVSNFSRQILDELAKSAIACVVADAKGKLIAQSDVIQGLPAEDFHSGHLPGWLITQKNFAPLDWSVNVGMPEKILFAQQKKFQTIWLLALIISLCVAMGALWGLNLYQEGLERKIRQRESQLVERNDQLQAAMQDLKAAKNSLQKKKDEIEEDHSKIQAALDEIFSLIQKVSAAKTFDIKFVHPALKKCWQTMQCESPDCPCYGLDQRRCWQIVGSFSQTANPAAACYQEGMDCNLCRFYKEVTFDPIFQIGEQFNNMMHILETQNKELQKAYAELQTSQSQMLQQEKMATVGQLAAGVAHEINNPLGFILSNIRTLAKYIDRILEYSKAQTEYLKGKEVSNETEFAALEDLKKKIKFDFITSDIRELISESLEGANRVKEIVQNLKNFSRVDQAEKQSANMNDCLESTINVIWNELKYKVTVNREYSDLPGTVCYPQQLSQVFMNLLINASQAIEDKGEITVKTWSEGETIFISIADTGTGIDEGKINRIFEPFFTTKKVGEGTGLGLSICYDIIVKNHDGEISVASEVGKGTVFTVRLPVVSV
jgi:signal transduction histidine kinase